MGWDNVGSWIGFALFVLFAIATFAWHTYELYVRPYFVPKDRICLLVLEMRQRIPSDPAEAAFIEEDAAWRRSRTYEQGVWRRVRRQIIREDRKRTADEARHASSCGS
jgi:hypothetical protein